MKKSDLQREWARVIDMCEGTGVDPKFCWKYEGVNINGMPYFDSELEQYEFALGIVEGKPVFVGDKLYDIEGNGSYCTVDRTTVRFNGLTWTKPSRAFMLNGIELPCPEKQNEDGYPLSILNDGREYRYLFNSYVNRDKVAEQLIKTLDEAAGK